MFLYVSKDMYSANIFILVTELQFYVVTMLWLWSGWI